MYTYQALTPVDLMEKDLPQRGRFLVLRRPKVSGAGTHDGLQLRDTTVVHLTDTGGVQRATFDEFAKGLPVTIVRPVETKVPYEIMQRVYAALSEQKPYHVTDWNCEKLVTWLIGEEPTSPQVNGWAIAAMVVGGLVLFARA
jgi:hypothetical protein